MIAPLDLQSLSAEAERRVTAILCDELVANTWRAYRHALKLWCVWYTLRYHGALPMPVPVMVVQQFMLDFAAHKYTGDRKSALWLNGLPPEIDTVLVQLGLKAATGPWALNTVETRVAALAAAHRWRKHPSPTETIEIVRLRRALRSDRAAQGIHVRHARPLSASEIERMMAACDGDLPGTRDRALIAVGFDSGGRRRSELAAMTIESLELRPDRSYAYMLGRSTGNPLVKPRAKDRKLIQGTAAEYLAMWLDVSCINSGPVWRRIEGQRVTIALSEPAIYNIIVKRARQAKIPGAIRAQSLRAGFVTEALRRNLPLTKIMDMSGHETLQSIQQLLWRLARGRLNTQRSARTFAGLIGGARQQANAPCPPASDL